MLKWITIIFGILLLLFSVYKGSRTFNFNWNYEIGEPIDSLNHVIVYYNGGIDQVKRRSTADGYNLGLEYQCVEFVKRYYYEKYEHKMPDSYGHAISFFNPTVADGESNKQRDLIQFTNPSYTKPQEGDLVVFNGTLFNSYGHVAIISNIIESKIEIIQQNPGQFLDYREEFGLKKTKDGKWEITSARILGWLRKS